MKIIALLLVLLLSGCASTLDKFGVKGAEVMDTARDSALFTLCQGLSVGAWKREFGKDPERAEAWRRLCNTDVAGTP